MAEIKDMFKKAMAQAKHLAGKDEDEFDDFEDEGFGEEPGLDEEKAPGEDLGGFGAAPPAAPEAGLGEKPKEPAGLDDEEHEEEHKPEPEPTPAPPAPTPSFEGVERLMGELDTIRSKLDLLQSHLQNIESREELAHTETQQFLQQLSFITQKLDNLEQEHSELERLIKGSGTA